MKLMNKDKTVLLNVTCAVHYLCFRNFLYQSEKSKLLGSGYFKMREVTTS